MHTPTSIQRRRRAALALKQGDVRGAEAVAADQRARDAERAEWRAEKKAVGGGCGDDDEAALARRARWLDLYRGPRKGREWWHWWMMRRRIAREKAADPSG